MLDCVCTAFNSAMNILETELIQQSSLSALKHSNSLNTCTINGCYDEIVLNKTSYNNTLSYIVPIAVPFLYTVFLATRTRSDLLSQKIKKN